ncbi:FUSC family protein [bacterium]|nr:FUSC family protein [bacterium]
MTTNSNDSPRPDSLQELLNSMQNTQAAHEEESVKLRRRVQWLEARRREFFAILSQGSSDPETVRKLDETEQQLQEIHQLLGRVESELKQSQMEIKQRILEVRGEEMARIQAERERIRVRRDKIRNQLLPQALNRVERLQEEEASIAQEDAELARRLRGLGQFDKLTGANES